MTHEKLIERENGLKHRITVSLHVGPTTNYWRVTVAVCQPGNRIWKNVYDSAQYVYQKLSLLEREKAIVAEQLNHVTAEEIQQAKLELWQQIKPVTELLNP